MRCFFGGTAGRSLQLEGLVQIRAWVPLCGVYVLTSSSVCSGFLPNMTLGGLVILNGPCVNVVACDGLLFQSLIPELAPP